MGKEIFQDPELTLNSKSTYSKSMEQSGEGPPEPAGEQPDVPLDQRDPEVHDFNEGQPADVPPERAEDAIMAELEEELIRRGVNIDDRTRESLRLMAKEGITKEDFTAKLDELADGAAGGGNPPGGRGRRPGGGGR